MLHRFLIIGASLAVIAASAPAASARHADIDYYLVRSRDTGICRVTTSQPSTPDKILEGMFMSHATAERALQMSRHCRNRF
jgi:hypothetical protein